MRRPHEVPACMNTPQPHDAWLTWRSGRTEPTSLATAGACRCTRFFEVVEFRELRGLLAFLGRDTVTVTALSAAGAMSTVLELARPAGRAWRSGQWTSASSRRVLGIRRLIDDHAQAAAAPAPSCTPMRPLPLSPASAMDPSFALHCVGESIASGDARAALLHRLSIDTAVELVAWSGPAR